MHRSNRNATVCSGCSYISGALSSSLRIGPRAAFKVTKRALNWAIANPSAAVKMFEKAYPKAESYAYALDQWKATIPLFKSPGGYFHQDNAQWSKLLPALVKQKLIPKALPPSSYYTNAYLGG